ncbi:GNAT family N-acetyltransferase [Halorussus gelatinilyticus]|uniref:GNAT family N-acetyltransferase n=1 Tax=Halorussus gelatinilyticus TaxID=2937524 RepID=A0A8U0IEN6_9EURY|nr:GNAT family protein [Halorussus gelatinilyticus]UPV99204.1 GNAT family N-acetyltransferase [Halorussus gelatinilyticus]
MPGVAFCHGERTALYTVERDDAAFYQRGRNHPAVRGPLGLADPTNLAQAEETVEDWVERDDSANLLVCLPPEETDGETPELTGDGDAPQTSDAEPTPIGTVNAWELDQPRGQVSYWLLPAYHGEGYATEAMTLFLDHLFDSRAVRGVEAHVFAHNDPSQTLLERLGFALEGKLRQNNFVEGEYRDEYVYGLLRDEWVEER